MTNNIRVFLWLALALAVYINFSQWQVDYAPKPPPPAVATHTTLPDGTVVASKPASMSDTVPQAAQSSSEPAKAGTVPEARPLASDVEAESQPTAGSTIHVVTDVLDLEISRVGGTLVRAVLPAYPVNKGQPDPVVLLNHDSPETNYVLQTGLTGPKNTDRPTHLAAFTSATDNYSLAAGQDELRVPLTWTDGNGVTVTKTFILHRSMYVIGLEYQIANASEAPWQAAMYSQISRSDPPIERSMFKVTTFATRGPALWASEKRGDKSSYHVWKKVDGQSFSSNVAGGWMAGLQHHFVTAVVPDPTQSYDYSMRGSGQEYLLAAAGPMQVFKPGAPTTLKENLFVGPKLQNQLETIHPELSRVADYGHLTFLSKPLFALLAFLHTLVKNWGVSIIFATFLLKLMFYPLAQYSGRSMARMRSLAPRMKGLQETYKDDREKLGRATMELYKTEKVNPLSGCLPMVIQMPVFLAFYWVLLESVEMRQAPFMGWINDLSARDPFFILPALNGLAMWMQYKLNPPPPDPVQAKVFQFMPLVFSVMFALFPAGLVLYWVTNTGLSILQQWNINRTIAAEDKARKSK
jgi:YidC/Oxa1 family membrane protein insertase